MLTTIVNEKEGKTRTTKNLLRTFDSLGVSAVILISELRVLCFRVVAELRCLVKSCGFDFVDLGFVKFNSDFDFVVFAV